MDEDEDEELGNDGIPLCRFYLSISLQHACTQEISFNNTNTQRTEMLSQLFVSHCNSVRSAVGEGFWIAHLSQKLILDNDAGYPSRLIRLVGLGGVL